MQINNMLPFLLNILSQREIQNNSHKTPTGTSAGGVNRQAIEKALETTFKGIEKINQDEIQVVRQHSPGQVLPDFLPLPLKSPLFTNSSFYIRNNREESGNEQANTETEVFLHLRTENLGLIWISLMSHDEHLRISFFSENPAYTGHLQEGIPVLIEDLKKLGYSSVAASALTRQGIRHCADVGGIGENAMVYIIDKEV